MDSTLWTVQPINDGTCIAHEVYQLSSKHPKNIDFIGRWSHELGCYGEPRNREHIRRQFDGLVLRAGLLEVR